ncbi:MAG: hypothetical protein ACYDFT_02920 [Thermoplasmata archaeon]
MAWILVASILGQLFRLSFIEFGALLTIGAVWLGLSCLANAIRCGRTHCWIVGIALPALAVVGGLNLATVILPWSTYISILWVIVLGSLVAECVIGPYLQSRKS